MACNASIGILAKVKMLWNISVMMPMKISVPQILCVRTRSSLSLNVSPGGASSEVAACWISAMRA